MGSSSSTHNITRTNNNGQMDSGVLRPIRHAHCDAHDSINPEKIKVLKLKCGIDKKLTSIDEKSNAVLKYRTPHFR